MMSAHRKKLLNSIDRFYEEEKFCDVTLICGADEERGCDCKTRSSGLEHDETLDCGSPFGSTDESRVLSGSDSTRVAKLCKIRCHKIVLCAASDYFAAMFSLNMREASESRVRLDSIPYGIMRSIVNFAYYG
ncbi:kelch-like protein 38 [Convolutriloba macropyga]|uniref:kelch-like protein 38 n=1 Tax=Convolutriloba macropyga TaxID=536237 RepID=UPI003F526D3B